MKPIGIILKNAREDNDLTQMEVMKRTGINNKTLSGYENGISEPDISTLAVLFDLYQLSADEVFGLNQAETKPLSPKEETLLELYKKLDKKQQDDLILILETLAQHNS